MKRKTEVAEKVRINLKGGTGNSQTKIALGITSMLRFMRALLCQSRRPKRRPCDTPTYLLVMLPLSFPLLPTKARTEQTKAKARQTGKSRQRTDTLKKVRESQKATANTILTWAEA